VGSVARRIDTATVARHLGSRARDVEADVGAACIEAAAHDGLIEAARGEHHQHGKRAERSKRW
jgi:hypothetical protein